MELTEERIAEIAAQAATQAVEKLKEPERKLTPGDGVILDETDKKLSDPKAGFKSFGHFCSDLVKAEVSKEISPELRNWGSVISKTAGYMEEGDLAQGGYLVPEEFSNKIMERSLETSIVRPRAVIQPMGSNRLVIPADVDTDHSSNYFGGITIYRTGEGGQKTRTNPTFGRIALTLHKVTGLCEVTDELLEDSVIAMEANLSRKFSQAIAFVEDDDFLNGTGANMPIGVLNAANPALVTVTAVTGQGASTIIAENIRDMWMRMYPAGHAKCIWIANIETFAQLFSMEMAVGTGGVPVWLPAGGMSGLPYQTLMGRPLIFTEKCQALGTAGDIALIDFSQYMIGQRGGLKMASSMHLRFDYDATVFRFVLRYDGQPTWLTTLTPRRGSNTLSPFVVLNGTRT